jgi:quercetin dioxygenase-like cupin family protein
MKPAPNKEGHMKRSLSIIAVCATLVCAVGLARAKDKAPAKPEAVTIIAADVKFGPAPPNLPAGGQIAVLHGDPGKKGVYAIRFKMPDGYKIPPHWHSLDEELTVVSGTFNLAMGDKAGENVHALDAGSYHYLPGKMHHSAEAKGETVVEIHGNGPFDIHYLNPADDPSKAASK